MVLLHGVQSVHGAAARCWSMVLLHGVRGAGAQCWSMVSLCCCKMCLVLLQNWLHSAAGLLQGVRGAAAKCWCMVLLHGVQGVRGVAAE